MTKRLLAGLLVLGIVGAAHGASDPTAKCQAAKAKAIGKKLFSKMKCLQKAYLKARAVDSVCLAKAETKFTAAIAKADAAGSCPGTAVGLETDVDACVATLSAAIATTTTTTTTSTTTPTPPQRLVFLTSTAHTGNLGGLAGADGICAARAAAASLPGTYKAWLSDTSSSAASRLTHASVPYKDVLGNVVASSWADLTDGMTGFIRFDETGAGPVGANVWTGTHADGSTAGGGISNDSYCGEWTFGMAGEEAVAGFSIAFDSFSGWTNDLDLSCQNTARLYCLQQ